jgi:acetylornithine deacetylase
MKLNERINDAVEQYREEALSLLQNLVQIPSLAGNEKPCQDIIAAKMNDIGLDVDVFDPPDDVIQKHKGYVPTGMDYIGRPNVVGTYRGEGGGKSLILNGHVDVVPIGPESYWSHSPWSGKFIDGKVYGRGSADMKGGVVSNLIAAQALKSLDVKLQGDLIIESVVDEELGGNGTLACFLKGYTADGCIFTEPSGFDYVAVSNRGAQYFRIIVHGTEGGTEYKHDLVNPIQKAMEVFQAVEAYSIMRESSVSHPLYDPFYNTKVPLGICIINGGELPSTVSSQCVMEGTIECLPNEDIHQVKADFKAYLEEWSAKDAWFKEHPIELEWFGLWFEASEISADHDLPVSLVNTINEYTGKSPIIAGAGGCDLRIPIKYGNTPAVMFGPSGGMIHSVDEYVEFEEVITVAKILAAYAVRWCGEIR